MSLWRESNCYPEFSVFWHSIAVARPESHAPIAIQDDFERPARFRAERDVNGPDATGGSAGRGHEDREAELRLERLELEPGDVDVHSLVLAG